MKPLSPVYEYFAGVSQQAMDAKPPYRGKVELLHFGDYVLVKSEISAKIERRWFHQETPIAYYHLPKELRLPIVEEMYRSGCVAKEIAELIGVSSTTIATDIKELMGMCRMTECSQFKAQDVTPTDLILKSTTSQKMVRGHNPQYAPPSW
jgi:AraC-like DNA-binding protein